MDKKMKEINDYISRKMDEEQEKISLFHGLLKELEKYLKKEHLSYRYTGSFSRKELCIQHDSDDKPMTIKVRLSDDFNVFLKLSYDLVVSDEMIPLLAVYFLKYNSNSFNPHLKYDELKREIYMNVSIPLSGLLKGENPEYTLWIYIDYLLGAGLERYAMLQRYSEMKLSQKEKDFFSKLMNKSLDAVKDAEEYGHISTNEWFENYLKENQKSHINKSNCQKPGITIPRFLRIVDEKKDE